MNDAMIGKCIWRDAAATQSDKGGIGRRSETGPEDVSADQHRYLKMGTLRCRR
jgi:hypothetical protein